MKVIADSGSTKTDWSVLSTSDSVLSTFTTQGLNPYHQSSDLIAATLGEVSARVEACRPYDSGDLCVYFYGSGVRPEQEAPMAALIRKALPEAVSVEAHSDMLGAARALCGRKSGIASILGTGANSCLYDGNGIIQHTPALGYILGDEGSGSVLGKRFIHDLYGGKLSEEIKTMFEKETRLNLPEIIKRVYRQPLANRFLASLSEFIGNHLDDAGVRAVVIDNFVDFLRYHIQPYNRPDLPVSFVGSVAWHYQDELREAAERLDFQLGTILKTPLAGLVRYHKL
jgi:N-acetylglucosamine kinase-like BadF-type ATPase